jgi:hypothetical protein
MLTPGMQIDNLFKKWVSSGAGGASGLYETGKQKRP